MDRMVANARGACRWIATRPPRAYLIAGWIVFLLGCYPGFLSIESALHLYEVRSGVYSDVHPTLMTLAWRTLELGMAGPFPMLLLQSGLFLFGLAAVLRTLVTARAAAIAASCVLLFPPVFVVMASIWADSLMAGALLGACGALLQPQPRWKVLGGVLLVLACDCRLAAVAAAVPILALVPMTLVGWKRIAMIASIAISIEGAAIICDRVLVDNETYELQQAVMLPDTISVLRRNHVTSVHALDEALAGVPIVDHARLRDFISKGKDPAGWWGLSHGDKRLFEPLATPDQTYALFRAWRHAVLRHPGAYLKHREAIALRLLGLSGGNPAVLMDLGDFDLLGPMHHRALPSMWERVTGTIVETTRSLQLFRSFIYLLLALLLVAVGKLRIVRVFAISGAAYEIAMMLFAPNSEYRYSHWLVVAATIAAVVRFVAKRYAVSR